MGSVLQPWVEDLTFMKQSVLICAMRGPDGIRKDHVAKLLIRWMRRCVLWSAFERAILDRPFDIAERKGGSFTGPSLEYAMQFDGRWTGNHPFAKLPSWQDKMYDLVREYLRHIDALPHHFQLHFMHAAEIIGYEHPDQVIRHWRRGCYYELVNDMHLTPESPEDMNRRLGDNEADWRARESVVAAGPG